MEFEIKDLKVRKEWNRTGEPKRFYAKMYVWIENETLFENLRDRRNRPYDEYRKHVIPVAMAELEKNHPEVYEELKDAKWSWNKNCGCSMCPCSPGFIANVETPFTISVTIGKEVTVEAN
jgi:hypothetical protein